MAKSTSCRVLRIPKSLVYTLTIIGIINEAFSYFFSFFIDLLVFLPSPNQEQSSNFQENQTIAPFESPLSAILIRELLPSMKLSGVVCINGGGGDELAPKEECVVCLCEFEGDEEIRCMKNCRHFFHRDCIDRWMDLGKTTCPLCKQSLVPIDLQKEYDQKHWVALCDDLEFT
ncbi:hypothetical protein Leryth_004125 [Lithospermum erythrorhizon]|nr:hypothetical protein Leryth_004125 [Lithospermum erythrorhizon]